MSKKWMLLIAVLVLSSLVLAQTHQPTQKEAAALAASPDTTSCAYSFSSGSGTNYTQYCLTVNGNIVQLQRPSGVEYISYGLVSEGYGVCDLYSNTAYYDYAANDSGNWSPTTLVSSTATSVKLNRATIDGIWQLTQTITQVKATAKSPGAVTVTMAIKNLTGITRTVYLLRFADVDAAGQTTNDFDYTLETAYGLKTYSTPGGNSWGLGLTNNTESFGHMAFTQNDYNGPPPCNWNVNMAPQPFEGDGSIGHIYTIVVPKSATKTVTLTYKPM